MAGLEGGLSGVDFGNSGVMAAPNGCRKGLLITWGPDRCHMGKASCELHGCFPPKAAINSHRPAPVLTQTC